jgi:hypothetical protein
MIADDKWRVISPGRLALLPTAIMVVRGDDGVIRVEWQDRSLPGHGYYLTRASAKAGAERALGELLELGYDP